MIALSVLIVIFIWAWLGFAFWRRLIAPYIKPPILKIFLAALFAGAWLVAPVLDEILGAREFDQLCRDMPPVKYSGPVVVGSGDFFDGQGRPNWKNSFEFSVIERNADGSNKIFASRDSLELICRWPMPIMERNSVYFAIKTGLPIVVTYTRFSKGGWLRRLVGFGDYQCPRKGPFPKDEELVVFKSK